MRKIPIFKFKINHFNIPSSELIRDIKRTAKLIKSESITASEYRRHGRYHDETINLRFGSWAKALKNAGLKSINRRDKIIKEILNDIKAVGLRLRKTSFSCYEYERNGKYKYAKIKMYFSSWGDAVNSAGLKYVKPHPPTKAELLENLFKVWLKLARQPKHNEVKKPLSQYGKNEYAKRFGSWQNALNELARYIRDKKLKVEIYNRKDFPKRTVAAKPKLKVYRKHKTRRNVDYRLRNLVLTRDSYRCRVCGRTPATGDETTLQIDHIIPWSSGGETILDNLQTLCMECNIGKGGTIN